MALSVKTSWISRDQQCSTNVMINVLVASKLLTSDGVGYGQRRPIQCVLDAVDRHLYHDREKDGEQNHDDNTDDYPSH